MKELTIVTTDNLHASLRNFIIKSESIIMDYDDMKELVLKMIKSGYMFNMDRDRLRDAMEDITFMLCPNDDVNRDRVEKGLEWEMDSDSDSDSDMEEINVTDMTEVE